MATQAISIRSINSTIYGYGVLAGYHAIVYPNASRGLIHILAIIDEVQVPKDTQDEFNNVSRLNYPICSGPGRGGLRAGNRLYSYNMPSLPYLHNIVFSRSKMLTNICIVTLNTIFPDPKALTIGNGPFPPQDILPPEFHLQAKEVKGWLTTLSLQGWLTILTLAF